MTGPHRRAPVGAAWWRRRFLRVAVVIAVIWITFGVVFGAFARGGSGDRDRNSGPPIVLAVVAAALVATFVAYRRLARPVSELLDSAERVGGGDYDARVQPSGPRAVRTLGEAFNDMAGQLQASDAARRRFLADVTHELRTPLTVLSGEIEAQLDGIHPRDDQHLASLLEETRRLGRLIGDLHTLALADAGKLVLHREPVELGHLVDDAIAAHLTLAERNAVTLAASVAPDVPVVDVDPARIRQVLDNLLANAVRHSPPSSTVTVEVTAQHGGVQVEVRDAGPGFPPDQLAHVFDRFARAADSQGSGLGLSIARDLVEAHGGTLTARNLPEGGAELTVMFPG